MPVLVSAKITVAELLLSVSVAVFALFLAVFARDLLSLSALMGQEPSVANAPLRTNVVIRGRSSFEYRITALPLRSGRGHHGCLESSQQPSA